MKTQETMKNRSDLQNGQLGGGSVTILDILGVGFEITSMISNTKILVGVIVTRIDGSTHLCLEKMTHFAQALTSTHLHVHIRACNSKIPTSLHTLEAHHPFHGHTY